VLTFRCTKTVFLIGPNASGKSNLLDVFRFLRDVSKPAGGGLQKAVKDRGGISKLRCLHHRKDNEVRIEIDLSDPKVSGHQSWSYVLGFKPEGKGAQRLLVSEEKVFCDGKCLLDRPEKGDKGDPDRLTQTHLEQIQANSKFREIANYFGSVTYLHLVPQLLKYGERIGGNRLEDDPFGQGFLERVARCPARTREARLRKIEKALTHAVPHFQQLQFEPDPATGLPHLSALYEHHRPNAGWQREDQFSDGTLRLLAMLWVLLDGDSLLLMEEPELSLHRAIVEQIPLLIGRIRKTAKNHRQVLISTHSEALLSNPGIDGRGVLVLETGREGSKVRTTTELERQCLKAGLSVGEVVLPATRPKGVEQLGLWE